jgi:hypothetical protein
MSEDRKPTGHGIRRRPTERKNYQMDCSHGERGWGAAGGSNCNGRKWGNVRIVVGGAVPEARDGLARVSTVYRLLSRPFCAGECLDKSGSVLSVGPRPGKITFGLVQDQAGSWLPSCMLKQHKARREKVEKSFAVREHWTNGKARIENVQMPSATVHPHSRRAVAQMRYEYSDYDNPPKSLIHDGVHVEASEACLVIQMQDEGNEMK